MKYEKSCGVVVFTRVDGEIKYVLAQALGGHYGFPKGHTEAGESEEETALREVFEEVHLKPTLIPDFRAIEEYDIPSIDVHKQVVFFLGEYYNQKIVFQKEELISAPLLPYEEALQTLTHEEGKQILRQAHTFLTGRKYYEAYDDRYRQIHAEGLQWFYDDPTPIVTQVIKDFDITRNHKILELGCGEGRDAFALLQQGYDLLATDISPAVIDYAKKKRPEFADKFAVLDCVMGQLPQKFDLIYAVAVIHILVEDSDRNAFYTFVRNHLSPDGIALICTMGDGEHQRMTDTWKAFDLQSRTHEQTGREVQIASTTCRVVNFETLHSELYRNGLRILQEGITASPPDFPVLMYALVKGK